MATIQEKIKEGKIVSYKFKGCLGRDEGGKQVFKCITWYPPENLTKAKSKKEAERTAAVWESELKQAYCYMERSISGMVGKGSLSHNNREFFAENVDQSRSGGNITSVQKVPLSSKVMLDRDDYEALAAAAEKFVVQEKKESKFRTLLYRAEKKIEELQSKIGELADTIRSLRGELEKYKDNSIMDRLDRSKLQSENLTLKKQTPSFAPSSRKMGWRICSGKTEAGMM